MDDEAVALIAKAGFRQPTPLQRIVVPHLLARRDVVVEAGEGTGRTVAYLTPLLVGAARTTGHTTAVILTSEAESIRKIQRQLKTLTRTTPTRAESAAIGIDEGVRKEARLLELHPEVIIASPTKLIDHIRQNNTSMAEVRYLAVEAPAQDPAFHRDLEFILSKCSPQCQTALFLPTFEGYELPRKGGPVVVRAAEWQAAAAEAETQAPPAAGRGGRGSSAALRAAGDRGSSAALRAAGDRGSSAAHGAAGDRGRHDVSQTTRPASSGGVDNVIQAIRAQYERYTQSADRDGVARLARLVRKVVPLGGRAAFAAHLLRESGISAPVPAAPAAKPAPSRGSSRAAAAPPPEAMVPGKLVRLFINAGRNRRVFPNDIYDLFTNTLRIQRTDMGEVKVLDNYSFVEIQSAYAARAVTELKSVELKGRKLTVDYARPRSEKKRGA